MNFKKILISSTLAVSCLCAFHMANAMRDGAGKGRGNGVKQLKRDGTGPHSPLSGATKRVLRRDGSGPNKDGRGPQGTSFGPRPGCPHS
jgi:hypothetical protein